MKGKYIKEAFSENDLAEIANKIEDVEKLTSGELRVSVKNNKPILNSNLDIRKAAEKEFNSLKMNETRDKTGVLIFIIMKEKEFYILADEGINSKVNQSVWDGFRDEMQIDFKDGKFKDGINNALDKIGKILNEHFPIKDDDTNELSNDVVLG